MDAARDKLLEKIAAGEFDAKGLMAIYLKSADLQQARLMAGAKAKEAKAGPEELREKARKALAGRGMSEIDGGRAGGLGDGDEAGAQ